MPVLLLLACTGASPATKGDAPAPARTATTATTATASPAGPASPDAPASPPVAATPDAPAAEEPAAPAPAATLSGAPADAKFQLAAYRDGELGLHRLGDGVFVTGGGGLAHLDARGAKLVAVEYGFTGQSDPDEYGTWNVLAFGGAWPDNAWLTTQFEESRSTSSPRVHRREGDRWKPVANKDRLLYWYHHPIISWREGQVIGARRHMVDPTLNSEEGGGPGPRQQKKIDAQLKLMHRGLDVLGPTPTPATMVLDPGMNVVRLAAAPTGELFALGNDGFAGEHDKAPRVQRWGLSGDAAVAGEVHRFDGRVRLTQLVVRSADEVYVGGARGARDRSSSVLTRFDGAAWTEEPAPEGPAITGLSVAPEGELWAVVSAPGIASEDSQARLWRRTARGAAWQAVELPELRFPDRAHKELVFAMSSRYHRIDADPAAAERSWPVFPKAVVALAGGDVWVHGETTLERGEVSEFSVWRAVVLRNRKVAEPLRMLPDIDLRAELLDWRSAKDWKPGEGCKDEMPAFVALRTLPRDAPRNQPEPAVEALIRDHAAIMPSVDGIFEFWRRGRRTIGLMVLPADQAAADAILAALERVAPGEPRTIECRWPRPRREFDLRSGAPIDAPPH